jgi:mono/diheme cytochrome c family protein
MRRLAWMLLVPAAASLAAAVVLTAGLPDFSAARPPSGMEERLARFALDRSIARHATAARNPLAGSDRAARAGLELYRVHCVSCHGAPGVDPTDAGASLNPPAPGLTLPRVQRRPDAELRWIVANGVRMTGMPAFGPSRSDEEIWQLVTAVRRLPALTAEEKRLLRGSAER